LINGRGGDRKSNAQPEHLKSYAEEAAAAKGVGVTPGVIQNHLYKGRNIDPAVLSEITGTDLDRQVVLDELARTPREEQPARLAAIRQERAQVRPAADPPMRTRNAWRSVRKLLAAQAVGFAVISAVVGAVWWVASGFRR
jgi:hypothetical protein